MLEIWHYVILFALSSLGGFLSGYLGVGGGIVYVPILSYFLTMMGMSGDDLVKSILANSLFTIIFSGSIASYKQYKTGNFHLVRILQTAWPGIISVLGLTHLIRIGDWYSYKSFNIFFACMLMILSFRLFSKPAKKSEEKKDAGKLQYGVVGFFTGIITALSGLGGGVVMTPVFTDIFHLPIKIASSISSGVIPIFAIAVGIYNLSGSPATMVTEWQAGYIVFPLVIPMVLSALVFAPIGVASSHKSNPTFIRTVFGIFVSIVLIKTLFAIFS